MAQRRKSSAPDLSGLLISKPVVRGFTSPKRFHAAWEAEQRRKTKAERERAREVQSGRVKAREARKTFGKMPNPKRPYVAFGGARVEA